mgnify:CR=1 FL=1
MAKQKRAKTKQRILYFYLNDALHRALQINRAEDTIIAFNFVEGKRVAYNYTDVQRNRKHAYSISEVAKLVNRHIDTIKRHLRSGEIRKPQQAYALDDSTKLGRYYFTGLHAGTYTISEQLQTDWVITAPPSPFTFTVTIGDTGSSKGNNFGNQ